MEANLYLMRKKLVNKIWLFCNTQGLAIGVVKFLREGYKIRHIFLGQKSMYSKEIIVFCKYVDIMLNCQKLGIISEDKVFKRCDQKCQ